MRILSKIRTVFFFTLVSATIAGLFAYSVWGERIPIEAIKNYVSSSEWTAPVFILAYILFSVFLPTTPMMAIAGILFGFWDGFFYTVIAGFISSALTFWLSRILGRSFVDHIVESKALVLLEKYHEKIAQRGILTVAILRIMPVMPFNVLNLIMGISKVKFKDYALGTVLGLIPSNVLTVYFGSLVFTQIFMEISLYLSIALLVAVAFWFIYKLVRATPFSPL